MQKIIISRTDNLGDVVLSLPVAGKLRQLFPAAQIIFLGKKYTEPVIRSCVHVDEYWDVAQLGQYDTSGVDAIVFLFPDRPVARWAARRKIPVRIGTSHRWWHWLYCNRRVNFSRKRSDLHEIQLNFKLLQPFGISQTVSLAEAANAYGLQVPAVELPQSVNQLLNRQGYKLILHPKSKGSAREWPLENYLALAKSLPEGVQVFVTGTEAEEKAVANECPDLLRQPNVTNLMGKLTLTELIAFIGAADALVACSTGPLHIAAALGKHAVGIYPNIRPMHPGRWQPVGPRSETVVFDQPDCRACADAPSQCACIQRIAVTDIRSRLLARFSEVSVRI